MHAIKDSLRLFAGNRNENWSPHWTLGTDTDNNLHFLNMLKKACYMFHTVVSLHVDCGQARLFHYTIRKPSPSVWWQWKLHIYSYWYLSFSLRMLQASSRDEEESTRGQAGQGFQMSYCTWLISALRGPNWIFRADLQLSGILSYNPIDLFIFHFIYTKMFYRKISKCTSVFCGPTSAHMLLCNNPLFTQMKNTRGHVLCPADRLSLLYHLVGIYSSK